MMRLRIDLLRLRDFAQGPTPQENSHRFPAPGEAGPPRRHPCFDAGDAQLATRDNRPPTGYAAGSSFVVFFSLWITWPSLLTISTMRAPVVRFAHSAKARSAAPRVLAPSPQR